MVLSCGTPTPSQRAAGLCAAAHPEHDSRDNFRDNYSVVLELWQKGVFYAYWSQLTLCPLPVCFQHDGYSF